MQTAVPDLELSAGARKPIAESSRAALPVLTHKRGRERLNLSWRFKFAAVGAISALAALSLLLQA